MWNTIAVVLGVMAPPVLGSSPWSLIQAKVSLDGAVGAFSSMDEALTFVQGLAEKVVGHNVPLTDNEKSAVDTIQAYIKRMLEDIKKQRDEDQHEVNRYRQAIQSCADVAKQSLEGAVKKAEGDADNARVSHKQCRVKEGGQHDATAAVCLKYDQHRMAPPGNSPPSCMNGLRTSDISTTDPATKKNMEQCVEQIHGWVVPLYDLYVKCKKSKEDHLGETRVCDADQANFEMMFCEYTTLLSGTCDEQTQCIQRDTKIMEEGDEEVKVAEAARQADCVVGHKVECLLKIFEETDNKKKPGLLEECKKVTPTCPDSINYPPAPGPTPCNKEATEPCKPAWLEQEYTSKSWYAKAPTTTCHACHPPHPCKVDLYEHNFGGWRATFSPGNYDTRALKRKGAQDDSVSSMEVEDGCTATLYAHPDFTGQSAVFTPGKYQHSEMIKKFPNDLVSSMKVETAQP